MENPPAKEEGSLPAILSKRPDLLKNIHALAKIHFKLPADVNMLTEYHQLLQIRDCSGMSNPVFIVNPIGVKDEDKIVIRFFESSAANFELENKVFEIAA